VIFKIPSDSKTHPRWSIAGFEPAKQHILAKYATEVYGGCSLLEASMDFDFQKARNSLHQLNNKVAQILAYAELMQLSLSGEKEKERIKLVIAGALECRQITSSLMHDMPKATLPGEN
jgi:hypothetical protein